MGSIPRIGIICQRKHPEQGCRTCLCVIRLAGKIDRDRLDAACKRALEINARSYSPVHSILKNGPERKPRTRATEEPAITHPNIRRPQRGACYSWPAFGGTRRLLSLKGYSC